MTDQEPPIYPQYCFDLSPTFSEWCFIQSADVDLLTQPPQYEGQPIFFYKNLPIRWVRLVGLIVLTQTLKGYLIITVDDASGRLQQCVLQCDEVPKNSRGEPDHALIIWPSELQVGAIVDIKGEVTVYRGARQLKIAKIKTVIDTVAELLLWEKREKFREDILRDTKWMLTEKDIRRARRRGDREEAEGGKREKFEQVKFDGVDWEALREFYPDKAGLLRRRYLKLVEGQREEEKKEFVTKVSAILAGKILEQRTNQLRGIE